MLSSIVMHRTPRTYDITSLQPIDWVEVPYYANGVRAGVPTDIGDLCEDTISIPRAFANACSYVVPVQGQSMRDFDLREGDELIVRAQDTADSGDIVIACVDGGLTVKAYYEDENGDRWLVPGNPDFAPIPIDEFTNIRIQGVVMRITHLAPRVSVRDCARIVRAQQKRPAKRSSEFPLLTQTALREGRAERVVELLQIAAKGSASDLMDELYHQALIGNISYSTIPTTRLREILNEHLAVNFGYENIRKYRRDI